MIVLITMRRDICRRCARVLRRKRKSPLERGYLCFATTQLRSTVLPIVPAGPTTPMRPPDKAVEKQLLLLRKMILL